MAWRDTRQCEPCQPAHASARPKASGRQILIADDGPIQRRTFSDLPRHIGPRERQLSKRLVGIAEHVRECEPGRSPNARAQDARAPCQGEPTQARQQLVARQQRPSSHRRAECLHIGHRPAERLEHSELAALRSGGRDCCRQRAVHAFEMMPPLRVDRCIEAAETGFESSCYGGQFTGTRHGAWRQAGVSVLRPRVTTGKRSTISLGTQAGRFIVMYAAPPSSARRKMLTPSTQKPQ